MSDPAYCDSCRGEIAHEPDCPNLGRAWEQPPAPGDILRDVEAAKKRVRENMGLGPNDSPFPSCEPFYWKGVPASRMSREELVKAFVEAESIWDNMARQALEDRNRFMEMARRRMYPTWWNMLPWVGWLVTGAILSWVLSR